MEVKANKEERGAVGMEVSDESSVVDITADMCNRREGYGDVRCIVYSKEESCENLGA